MTYSCSGSGWWRVAPPRPAVPLAPQEPQHDANSPTPQTTPTPCALSCAGARQATTPRRVRRGGGRQQSCQPALLCARLAAGKGGCQADRPFSGCGSGAVPEGSGRRVSRGSRMQRGACAFICLSFAACTRGATFYVSNASTAALGTGSLSEPFTSLQACVEALCANEPP